MYCIASEHSEKGIEVLAPHPFLQNVRRKRRIIAALSVHSTTRGWEFPRDECDTPERQVDPEDHQHPLVVEETQIHDLTDGNVHQHQTKASERHEPPIE